MNKSPEIQGLSRLCSLVFGGLFLAPQQMQTWVIEFFRGRPRGGENFTSLSKCSRPFIQSVKSTLSHLRVATLSGAPRQAPLALIRLPAE